MRKAILWLLGIALLALASPVVKNVYLFATYEHGHEALTRTAGQTGQLAGVWEGTFDTYECGIDQRQSFRLALDAYGEGQLDYSFFGDRIGTSGAPNLYSWAALLPYDRDMVRTYSASVRDSSGVFVIEPGEPWFSEYRETEYMAYHLRGDSLYFAYVNVPNDEPKEWGLWSSDQLVSVEDLLLGWW